MPAKAGDVEGDEPGGNGGPLGPAELDRGRCGGRSAAVPAELAGGAGPLVLRVGVPVGLGAQPEEPDERQERPEGAGAGSPGAEAGRHGGGG